MEEFPLRKSQEQVDSLWVRIRDKINKGQLVIGVYYRPPDQGETVDEAFLLQMWETLCSWALDEGLQPFGYLLERPHGKLQEV